MGWEVFVFREKNALPRGPHFSSKNIYSQTFFSLSWMVLEGIILRLSKVGKGKRRRGAEEGKNEGIWFMAKNELLPRVDYVSAFANARYKNFF